MFEYSIKTETGSMPQTCSGTHLQLRKIILKVLPDAFDASECWHVVNMRFEHLSRRLNEHLHRCRVQHPTCLPVQAFDSKGRSGLRGTDKAKPRGRAARLWFESLTLLSVAATFGCGRSQSTETVVVYLSGCPS